MQRSRETRRFPIFFLLTLMTALLVLAVSVLVQARLMATAPETRQVIAGGASLRAPTGERPANAPILIDVVATRPRSEQQAKPHDCAQLQVC